MTKALLFLASFLFAIPPAVADEGIQLVRGLEAADFSQRVQASELLAKHLADRYRAAASAVSHNEVVPSKWPLVRAEISKRADADEISELRQYANQLGGEVAYRFQALAVRRDRAIRHAALAAGLNAPGDFEAEMVAHSQKALPPTTSTIWVGAAGRMKFDPTAR